MLRSISVLSLSLLAFSETLLANPVPINPVPDDFILQKSYSNYKNHDAKGQPDANWNCFIDNDKVRIEINIGELRSTQIRPMQFELGWNAVSGQTAVQYLQDLTAKASSGAPVGDKPACDTGEGAICYATYHPYGSGKYNFRPLVNNGSVEYKILKSFIDLNCPAPPSF